MIRVAIPTNIVILVKILTQISSFHLILQLDEVLRYAQKDYVFCLCQFPPDFKGISISKHKRK